MSAPAQYAMGLLSPMSELSVLVTAPCQGRCGVTRRLMHRAWEEGRVANKTEQAKIVSELLEALEDIAKGEGRYSHDHLTHAENCIEDMKAIAVKAIAKVTQ